MPSSVTTVTQSTPSPMKRPHVSPALVRRSRERSDDLLLRSGVNKKLAHTTATMHVVGFRKKQRWPFDLVLKIVEIRSSLAE